MQGGWGLEEWLILGTYTLGTAILRAPSTTLMLMLVSTIVWDPPSSSSGPRPGPTQEPV